MDTFLSLLWILFCAVFFAGAIIKNIQKEDTPESIGWVMIVAVSMFGLILLIGCIMNSSIFDNFGMEKSGAPGEKGRPNAHYGIADKDLPANWSRGKGGKIKVRVGEKEKEFTSKGEAQRWEHEEKRRQSGERRTKQFREFLETGKVEGDPAFQRSLEQAQARIDSILDGATPLDSTKISYGFTDPYEKALMRAKAGEFLLVESPSGDIVTLALKDGKPVKINTPEADEVMRQHPDAKYINPEVKAQAEKLRNEPAQPSQEPPKPESGKLDPTNGVPDIKSEPGPSSSKPAEPASSRPFAVQSLESLEFAREEVEHKIQMQNLLHERGFTGKNPETEALKMQRDQLDREISRRKNTEELWNSPRIPSEMRKYRRDLQKIISTEEDLVSKGFKPDPEVEKYRQELDNLNDNVGAVVTQLPIGRELMPMPDVRPKESPGLFDRWLRKRTGGSLFEKLPGETKKPGQLSTEESSKNPPLSEVADEVSHFDPLRGIRQYEKPDRDPRLAGGPKEPWEDADPAVNVWNEIMSQKGSRRGRERRRQERWLKGKGGEPLDAEPVDSRENAVFHEYGEDGTGLNPNGETSGQLKRRPGFNMKGVDSHFPERRQRSQAAEETEPAKEVGPEEASQPPFWGLLFGHDPYNPSGLVGNERAPLPVENAGKGAAKTKSQVSEQLSFDERLMRASIDRLSPDPAVREAAQKEVDRLNRLIPTLINPDEFLNTPTPTFGRGGVFDIPAFGDRVLDLFRPPKRRPGMGFMSQFNKRAPMPSRRALERRIDELGHKILSLPPEERADAIAEFNRLKSMSEQLDSGYYKPSALESFMQNMRAVDVTSQARHTLEAAVGAYNKEMRTIAAELHAGKIGPDDVQARIQAAYGKLKDASADYDTVIASYKMDPRYDDIPFDVVQKPSTTVGKTLTSDALFESLAAQKIDPAAPELRVRITPEQAVQMHKADSTGEFIGKGKNNAHIIKDNGELYLVVKPSRLPGIDVATNPLHEYNGRGIARSAYGRERLSELQKLHRKRAIAETIGDQAAVDRIDAAMRQLTADAAVDVPAFDAIMQEIVSKHGSGTLPRHSNGVFGSTIDSKHIDNINKYITDADLGDYTIMLSRDRIMGPDGTPIIAPGTEYIVAPRFITAKGEAAVGGAPGFRNGFRPWRDAKGRLRVQPEDVSKPEELIGSGVLEQDFDGSSYVFKNIADDNILYKNAPTRDPVSTAGRVAGATAKGTGTAAKRFGSFASKHWGTTLATTGVGTVGYLNWEYNNELNKKIDEELEAYMPEIDAECEKIIAAREAAGNPVASVEARAIRNGLIWKKREEISPGVKDKFDKDRKDQGAWDLVAADTLDTLKNTGEFINHPVETVTKAVKDAIVPEEAPAEGAETSPTKEEETTKEESLLGDPWSFDKMLTNAKNWERARFGETFGKLPVSHTLTGAGLGAAAGGTVGAMRYLLGRTNNLSKEEKKRRRLMKMILSNASIGAGLGATMGGIADIRQPFVTPPEIHG